MTFLEILLAQSFPRAIGWSLLHLLWQGAVVGLLFGLANYILRDKSPQSRYLTGCIALLIIMTLPVYQIVTHLGKPVLQPTSPWYETVSLPAPGETPTPVEAIDIPATPSSSQRTAATGQGTWITPFISWITAGWFLGALFLFLKQIFHWRQGQNLRRQGTRPVPDEWMEKLAGLSERMGVSRAVQLMKSTLVKTPMVIGWLKPVILFPVSMVAGLPPSQLEAVLAHELAHIKRHDYLVNLVQVVVETLYFFHPVVWWISHRIRTEREYCCDDLAVTLLENPMQYARAITEAERLRITLPHNMIAFTGGKLMDRIKRIVTPPQDHSNPISQWLGLMLVFGILLAVPVISKQTIANPEPPILTGNDSARQMQKKALVEIEERYAALEHKNIDTVILALGNKDWLTRAAAAKVIGEYGRRPHIEKLMGLLEDENGWVRQEAAWSLGRLGAKKAVPALIVQAGDSHTGASKWAIRALGILGARESVEVLNQALFDPDPEVRESAAWALGKIGTRPAAEALVTALDDENDAVRADAVRGLGHLGHRAAVLPLIDALRAENRDIREAAAKSLGQIGDKQATESMIAALGDADVQVREQAARGLGKIGVPEAVPALLQAISDESPRVREAVCKTLGQIGDERAVADLTQAVEDTDEAVQIQAREALRKIEYRKNNPRKTFEPEPGVTKVPKISLEKAKRQKNQ